MTCAATEVESTKRKVTFSTYQKWRRDFDIGLKTVTWMDCATETSARKTYVKCAKYKSRIIARRNYSDRWINGAHSLRTSTIRDHAKSEQHQHAMSILCLEKGSATRGESSAASTPIIAALTSLSDNDRAELRKKFDIVFHLAQEKLVHCTTHNTVGDNSDDDSDPETECFEMLEEWDHLVLGMTYM